MIEILIQDEEEQYITMYSDDDYVIWIDISEQVINVFLANNGLTIHFSYEDFGAFRKAINKLIWIDMEEQIDIFLDERGLTLHFAYEDFFIFREIINSMEISPRFGAIWN